jgi:hypothetical protein
MAKVPSGRCGPRVAASAGASRRTFVGTRARLVAYLSSEAVGLSFMRFFLAIILVTLASTAQAQSREHKAVDWRTFEIPDFGTTVQYPAGIFSPAGESEKGVGQRFERADGRAILSIYSRPMKPATIPQLT